MFLFTAACTLIDGYQFALFHIELPLGDDLPFMKAAATQTPALVFLRG